MMFVCRFSGTNPAPIPWILCRPGLIGSCFNVCVITGDVTGSTAIALKLGFLGLITSATPVIDPPVPTPLQSRLPRLAHPRPPGHRPARPHPRHQDVHLSVRVLPDLLGRRLTMNLGVGGVLKLLRHEALLVLRQDLLGLLDRPAHPLR